MAIKLTNTRGYSADGVKILAYGQAGTGKTSGIATMPAPVILSAEGGLLPLRHMSIPVIEIRSADDVRDAFSWCSGSDEAKQFQSVAIDSLSEIAEVILAAEKRATKDPRQAYGAMQDAIAETVRAFRDLPGKHVYMTAKLDKSTDETGKVLFAPSAPGQRTGQGLPYFFDEVLACRTWEETTPEGKKVVYYYQCQGDGAWLAKDRSGSLDAAEPADGGIGAIIAKIQGAK